MQCELKALSEERAATEMWRRKETEQRHVCGLVLTHRACD